MTNYVYLCNDAAGETNSVFVCDGIGGATNMSLSADCGGLRVRAWRDLDRNGIFDAGYDIVQTSGEIGIAAVVRRKFTFGDIDGDGVADLQERSDGTDPYSRLSLRISRNVTFNNDDPSAAATNYYCISTSPDASAVSWALIDSNRKTVSASMNATNGCLYAFVMRDVNGNGVYEEGVDILYRLSFTNSDSSPGITMKDADGDGVFDSEELAEGTAPMDARNYCYHPVVHVKGIFSTTNQLTCCATFGTNEIMSATVMTNDELQVDFGHLATANRERVVLWFWDDANSNAVRDVDEVYSTVYATPQGHATSIEEPLPLSGFDADRNELPDYWELTCGLASSGLDYKSYTDEDCDGLVNLHEYWAGTDPLTPDGSNTLLSVCARSIDDRIASVTSSNQLYRFVDYEANAQQGVFVMNANFWADGIDFSCVSALASIGNELTGSRSATAITRRHVILATHWNATTYTFCDAGGTLTNLQIEADHKFPIAGTDLTLARLNGDLPTTIKLPKILGVEYEGYLASARFLPALCMTHCKAATVLELSELNCSARNSNKVTYHQLGAIASTNYVSEARADIRSMTSKGNSGSPSFLLVGDDLVFLFSKHMGFLDNDPWGVDYGPMATHYLNEIRLKILEWEGGNAEFYQLDMLDPCGYDILQQRGPR